MQTYFRADGNVMPAVLPNPWLIGKREDILYFFLPVVVALLFFFMEQHPAVSNSMLLSMIAAYGFGLRPSLSVFNLLVDFSAGMGTRNIRHEFLPGILNSPDHPLGSTTAGESTASL